MLESIQKYQFFIAKATLPDPECNNHGHRLHYLSDNIEDEFGENKKNSGR